MSEMSYLDKTRDGTALERLTAELRRLRLKNADNASYRQIERTMALRGHSYSRSAVARALSGKNVPSWSVVQALGNSFEGDLRQLRELWEEAESENLLQEQSLEGRAGSPDKGLAATEDARANALAKIIDSLSATEDAVLLLGNLLIVKHNGRLAILEVDEDVRNRLAHSKIMSEPGQVLDFVEKVASEHRSYSSG